MDIPWLEIGILAVLTVVNAFFTGSEIAFVSLREGQLQRLDEEGGRGAKVARMTRNPTQLLASMQVGITLAGFFSAATGAVALEQPVEDALSFLGSAAHKVALPLVTIVIAFFTLVFGELAPKRVAMQRAEAWARLVVNMINFIAQATRPVIWLLEHSTNIVVRLTGNDPHRQREEVTEEEIRDLLEAQEAFTPEQRSIITGAFEVAERTLREIVVPRGSVVSVPNTATAEEAVRILAEVGHSRAPVHTGDLDDVLGIVHVRDLIHHDGMATDQTRPATVLPESLGVLDALRRMQSGRQQIALVVNEHGGVEGIITVEDLLEEIVGEIYDEFDRDITDIVRADDGSVTIPGTFPIHDLDDLDVSLPDPQGAYATIAGYALDQLGHIPVPGETITGESWIVEVLEVTERAITKVRVTPVAPPTEPDDRPDA
jgi:putative hemolysin